MASDARRKAEEALRYDHDHANSPEVRRRLRGAVEVLLAAEPEGKTCGSIFTVRSDATPAQPLPTCANCGSNLIAPAPSPARAEVREAAEIVRAILTAHDARLSDGGCLTYGHPRSGTGFPAAIEWLRRYDAARGGE